MKKYKSRSGWRMPMWRVSEAAEDFSPRATPRVGTGWIASTFQAVDALAGTEELNTE